MECNDCGESVEDGTRRCPHCGYSPWKVLFVNAAMYYFLGAAITITGLFGPIFVFRDAPVLLTALLSMFVGLAILFHGVNFLAGALFSDPEEDLSEYSFLIYR